MRIINFIFNFTDLFQGEAQMRIPWDVRRDIPLTSELIYFDNAATSLTPIPVIRAMDDYYLNYRANVHRGVHRLSMKASEMYEKAREVTAKFIRAKPNEIIFVKNATEAINLVAMCLKIEKGEKIVTSELEHHSNLLPWFKLQRKGIKVELIEENGGIISVEDAKEKIDEETKLVAISLASNVFGTLQPVKEIAKVAKEHGALVLVDAAQAIGHSPVDVEELGVDFLAFSGHKGTLGPTGIGALYAREEAWEYLDEGMVGGGTIEDVDYFSYKLAKGPERYEAGTPNIGGAIGMMAGIEYVEKIGPERIEKYERRLAEETIKGLLDAGIEILGEPNYDKRIGLISFLVPGYGPHEVAEILNEHDIMVRSGHHCCLLPMKKRGIPGTVRASYHCYNTLDEVEQMLEVLGDLKCTG